MESNPIPNPQFHHLYAIGNRLALYSGSRPREDTPILVHTYHVSTIPGTMWPEVVGLKAGNWGWQGNGNLGTIYHATSGRTFHIDTTGWTPVQFESPVPKPHDGREYTWKWNPRGGVFSEWVKDYFERCPTCDRYHNPAWAYCETCYRCHAPRRRPCTP